MQLNVKAKTLSRTASTVKMYLPNSIHCSRMIAHHNKNNLFENSLSFNSKESTDNKKI